MENNIINTKYIIITVGDWDLGTMFPKQCNISNIKPHKHFKQWINIKKDFKDFYNVPKKKGMAEMLEYLNIELKGRHHSGIDDCRNTARIFQKMIEDGYKINENNIKYL